MSHRVAVIPGDGIGPEVTAQNVKVLQALGAVELHELPWGADHYLTTGQTVPANGYDLLRSFDAILIGALGDPRVPDNRHARHPARHSFPTRSRQLSAGYGCSMRDCAVEGSHAVRR